MKLQNHVLCAALVMVSALGCASKPPQYETIPDNSNPISEIQKTEEMIQEARDRQVDILSPENFTDAKKTLSNARRFQQNGKSNKEILAQVAYSRGWLKEAGKKAELAQTSMKEIRDARSGALRAKAPEYFPAEWQKAERELESITTSMDNGHLLLAEKNGPSVTSLFRELEIKSVTKESLQTAAESFSESKKMGAEKKAPKSFKIALMKYENAEKIIRIDPRNQAVIQRAANEALRESQHLAAVMKQVSSGNTEDLVLLTERQQRTITSLRDQHESAEEELHQSQEQLSKAEKEQQELTQQQAQLLKAKKTAETADELRKNFQPNEAEVYTENGKVKVRLKALQFPSNQATLTPKNQPFLNKLEAALGSMPPAKITIEGHTDSTGRVDANKLLAQKRAQSVQNFLVSKGAVDEKNVNTVGVGPDNPINSNATPRGRAQNRRIDIIIETE